MSADADIRSAIEAAGGAIPFDRFMELALYGEHGFYTRRGRAGHGGDFLTSPEVGPLFGTVIARYLDAEWARLGRPGRFTVVDAGAGPGSLARAVLSARPECSAALRYVAVERSTAQRADHPAGVESLADLPAGAFDGVVLANELLDNMPFRLLVFDGGWREAYVSASREALVEVLSAPLDPAPAALPSRPAHGARAPLHDAGVTWLDHARTLARAGSVIVFDYARPTTARLATAPWRTWLRTYRGHARGRHYLVAPGEQDITTEIALDQFPPPAVVSTQAEWLRRWGIDDLVDEGKRAWEAAAVAPGLDALRMRSRGAEAAALLDPTGLGAFLVAEWRG